MNRREPGAAGQDHRADAGADAKTPAALCELGHQHLKAGRALDAQLCCEQALAADGSCADAMHLMGLLSLGANQADHAIEWLTRAVQQDAKPRYLVSLGEALERQGRIEEAFKAFDRAVELDVDSAEAWKPLARILADLNRHHEAALAFNHVLKLDPEDADAAYQAGVLFFRAGRPEDALALLDRAEQLQPDHAPILKARALVIGNLGRFEDAVALLSRAHALDSDDADICNDIGLFLRGLDRPEEALTWFDKSLARRPDSTAAYQAGLLLFRANKPEEALAYLDRADQWQPDHAPILQARAVAIGSLGRLEEAVALLSRAHALAPDDADICNNMGAFLQRLGRNEEALTWSDKALARSPDLASAFINKAFTLTYLNRFDEALAVYAALKAIDPDNAEAEWSASLLQLLTGNFEAGWIGREARWKDPNLAITKYGLSRPMWLGKQPVDGKTILIHQDEGLGDTIQFTRYVPVLASLGARVILLVDDALMPLLSKLPGVAECVPVSAHRSLSFDFHCANTSLPLAFNTSLATIPATVPYLPAPEEARRQIWERRLGAHDKMRVGLVWSGNPRHRHDRYRSISLRDLSPLLDIDATFVSLQKEPRPADQATLRERPEIVDLTVHLTDLAETAALISCLDLVITVDTSMAHLAGALALPTWILLPHIPDWRWLLDRDDSPWYPTALLFRQDQSRDYGRVIARVRSRLAARIKAWRADGATPGQKPEAGPVAETTPAGLCELGHQHRQAGRVLDARVCCEQALAKDPNCAEAMHLLGLLSLGANQADHAIEWFARAVRHDEKSAYLLSLGNALKRQGKLDGAFRAFDRAVEIDIDSPLAWKPLAQLLADLNRCEEATLAFQHVLKLDPEDADAAFRAGLLLLLAAKQEEALGFFDWSDRLRPNHVPTQKMRMLTLALQDRALFERTLSEMDRAPGVDPDTAYLHNHVGDAYRRSGRHDQALIWFEKALTLRPDFTLARSNKAYSLARLHRFDEALADYAALKVADPAGAEWNQALLQLLLGNFEAGWAGREARWNVPSLQLARYNFSQPMWLGKEPIAGKTILIYQEEGFGDAIQFARYVPMVAAQGARVILMVADTLVPLLSKLPGVTKCVPRSLSPALEFDTYCGITSLPLAFATRLETIPSTVPYLPAPDPVRVGVWEERLGPRQKLRVGLVWSGNPGQSDDHNRSMPLSTLSSLLDLDATFVSLQKDPRPGDRALLAQTRIIDLTPHLTDFAETAALVSCLDLVISVCTSTAHLAGALACPTWILLPHTPDWRWLLGRDDSPWYPTARLFRQDESGDYERVIARVQAELRDRIASWSPDSSKENANRLSLTGAAAQAPTADDADSLHLLGLQSLHEQQFDQAVDWLSRAIRRDPKPLYLTTLGTTLLRQGRHEDALQVFDKAVQLKPDDPELWKNLGGALFENGRPADAILCFQHALKLDPGNSDAAYRVSLLLYQEERYEEALSTFSLSAQLQPEHFPTIYMRALTFQNLKRFEEALADNERAHALDPDNPDTCHNMGNVLRALFRQQEAIAWYDKSLALRPNSASTLGNKAVALAELRCFDEAITTYREAIATDPSHAVAEWNLGLLLLLLGDFETGWATQEARWKVGSLSSRYPKIAAPKWLGAESIAGKTIVACANEGLGDTIQFVRYAPMLAARGAHVVLIVQDSLCVLLSGMEGIAQCLPMSASELPDCDFHLPLSSLPLAFGTRLNTIPAQKSYLPAPPVERVRAWEARLGRHDKLRVGLVWSGNPKHNNDRNRSITLARLAPLFDLDATFISLQKDPRPEDRSFLATCAEVVDLTAALTDFVETAALIACLDLVITVDTSVAHLSAALGCATWILLPYTPDYRWLLDREDSPWYPTARLFRQDESRDYGRVIDHVRSQLAERIEARPAAASRLTLGQKVEAGSPASAKTPAALCELGRQHLQAGRTLDAQSCCEQALVVDPHCAEAMHLLGLVSLRAEQPDRAIDWFARAGSREERPAYLLSLGNTLKRQGRLEDAFRALDRVVEIDIDSPVAWKALARLLADLNRHHEAALAFNHVLKLDPHDADAAYQSGVLFFHAGKTDDALVLLDRAEQLRPGHAPTLQLRALAMSSLGQFEEAVALLSRAHTLAPDNTEICVNMGTFLRRLGRYEEALTFFDKALAIQPDVKILHQKGYALERLHRFDEALAIYAAVKTADPDNAEADLNRGLLQLLLGNFEEGWVAREARWKASGVSIAKHYEFSQPMWRGEPIDGKTILIYQDEGLGDVIQFARYLSMVVARGARVILHVDGALVRVLSDLSDVIRCVSRSDKQLGPFDAHCAITSLPLAFNTSLATIPSRVPYLQAPDHARRQAWERRLGSHDKMRVGLVWSGNRTHPDNHNRQIALQALRPLLELDATFVSLQKLTTPEDQATLQQWSCIADLTIDLVDLAETAALITCLDLVITVDTSIAHLAGALACPTWILLSYTPDWRWMLDRDDSPWYPTARLFRQDESRDYGRVIARVRNQLAERIEAWRAGAASPSSVEQPAIGPGFETETPVALCGLANQHLEAGRTSDAQLCCEQALALDPGCADAMHLMGLLSLHANQDDRAIDWLAHAVRQDAKPQYLLSLGEALRRKGRTEEALKAFDKAIEFEAGSPVAWKALAQLLADLNRHHDAALAFQQVFKLDAGDANAAYQAGFLFFSVGKPNDALPLLDRAEQLRPDHAPTLQMRAVAIGSAGRSEEAVILLSRAHALAPDDADICNNMGVFLQRLGRREEALTWFDKSLARSPNFTAAYQAGLLLIHADKPEEALAYLDRADQLRPDHAPLLQARATAIGGLHRFDEAAALLSRAHSLAPDDAEICNSMGIALQRLDRHEEALTWFDRALARRPNLATAFTNKGFTLGHLHRFDEALAVYAVLKVIDPDNVEAEWCASLLHLLIGNLEAGWAGREARWKLPEQPLARYGFSQPMWLGKQPIHGKTILVHQDEGLGDVIQFVRYVPALVSLGARVILLVDDALVPLLSKLPGVLECLPKSVHSRVTFDFHCAITSLPLAFNTSLATIPATVPYLPAAEEARRQTWERRLGPHDKMRVGLVWSGNPKHANDRYRSIPLRDLCPLLDLDATFVNLQKDPRPSDQATLRECPGITDLTVHFTDLTETAALVSCLDLVITVDTSMAHLAGALARPTWILLPHTPDWRWLLDRHDSPWYPTARLFRQDESRNYGGVIERVRGQLAEQIEAWDASQNRG